MVTIKIDPENIGRVDFNPGKDGVNNLELVRISGILIYSLINILAQNGFPTELAEHAVMHAYKVTKEAIDKTISFKGKKGTDD